MSKLLIVEDDEVLAGIISDVLAEAEHATIVATTAEDALDLLQAHHDISAILADHRLKGDTTGLEVLRTAQSDLPNLRCMLMSGDVRSLPDSLDGIEVLPKPVRMKELIEKIC